MSRAMLVYGALALLLVCYLVTLLPARNTAFSITARTDVLAIEPFCAEELVWDLPPGHVVATGAASIGQRCAGPPLPVTMVLRGGARAEFETRPNGRVQARVSAYDKAACATGAHAAPIAVSVDGADLTGDAEGYFYLAGDCDAAAPQESTPVILSFSGRAILGRAIPYGAGWRDATPMAPILQHGEVLARTTALYTGERLTLLEEQLDPGSVVDTHPCLGPEEHAGGAAQRCRRPLVPAVGFVRIAGGSEGLEVQAYPEGSVGVTPHGGEPRELRLTQWDRLKASTVVQALIAAIALFAAFVGRLKDWFELRRLAGPTGPTEPGRHGPPS
jgi:hypothetical protein